MRIRIPRTLAEAKHYGAVLPSLARIYMRSMAEKMGFQNKFTSPCKTFKKKESLACFRLGFNRDRLRFDHLELWRVVNPKDGEYYVLPASTLQKQEDLHLSYHKSGAFHWRTMGKRIFPQDGEADFRNPQLVNQHLDHLLLHLQGYCLAIGPRVSRESLNTMLHILSGYVVYDVKQEGLADYLFRKKQMSLMLPPNPSTPKAMELVEQAFRDGKAKVHTREEIIESLKKLEPGAKLVEVEPFEPNSVGFDIEVMKELLAMTPPVDLKQNWPLPEQIKFSGGSH